MAVIRQKLEQTRLTKAEPAQLGFIDRRILHGKQLVGMNKDRNPDIFVKQCFYDVM